MRNSHIVLTMEPALVLRVALLGIVTGMRTCLPFALLVWLAPPVAWLGNIWARVVITLASASELVLDKLPKTPSRLKPAGMVSRVITGGLMGWALTAQAHGPVWLGVTLGMAGAVGGAFAGNNLRGFLGRKTGKPDLWFALSEDLLAVGIGVWAILGLGAH
jgi:uncharacterized membrane protein